MALSGDPADGTIGVFSLFRDASVNNGGEVLFIGSLQTGQGGVDFTNDGGLWRYCDGTLALLVREGDAAPGPNAGIVNGFYNYPVINDVGDVAALVSLRDAPSGTTTGRAILIWSDGLTRFVTRDGLEAPGTGGARFASLGSPHFNSSSNVLFDASLGIGMHGVDASNSTGKWATGQAGELHLVAREGQDAPGTNGADFDSFSLARLRHSNRFLFWADLETGEDGVTVDNDEGLWTGAIPTPRLVARAGDAAPGANGAVYSSLFDSAINDVGTVAFVARLVQGANGVDSTNDQGLWIDAGTGPTLALREGDAAPGVPGGAFRFIDSNFSLNDSDDIAFTGFLLTGQAGVDVDHDAGIWASTGGAFALVVREGSEPPGAPGAVFEALRVPSMNASGDIAFTAVLRGNTSSVDTSNDEGIFVRNAASGEIVLLAREGDLFDVADDPLAQDLRTISAVAFVGQSGDEIGRFSALNDAGQMVVQLWFTDGSSGVFLAQLPRHCPANLDGDEDVDVFDLLAYLDLWFDGAPGAELTGDDPANVNVADLLEYLSRWFDGGAACT